MFRRNPVSEPRPQSKKPGFCENLRILTRCSEETRFLIPAPNPRNRVSTRIYAASPDVPKKPGFCTPPPIQETGFLRAFTPPHQMFRRNPVSEPRTLLYSPCLSFLPYKTCLGAIGISIINSLPSPGAETQVNFPP